MLKLGNFQVVHVTYIYCTRKSNMYDNIIMSRHLPIDISSNDLWPKLSFTSLTFWFLSCTSSCNLYFCVHRYTANNVIKCYWFAKSLRQFFLLTEGDSNFAADRHMKLRRNENGHRHLLSLSPFFPHAASSEKEGAHIKLLAITVCSLTCFWNFEYEDSIFTQRELNLTVPIQQSRREKRKKKTKNLSARMEEGSLCLSCFLFHPLMALKERGRKESRPQQDFETSALENRLTFNSHPPAQSRRR